MTLLDDIINGASGETAVSTLLRQLRVLAARADTARLAEWVAHELTGYKNTDEVPPYRGPFEPTVLGHFVGYGGAQAKNLPIPCLLFPKDIQDGPLFKVTLNQPIAELEDLATQDSVNLAWTAEAVAYYNHCVDTGKIRHFPREDMALLAAARLFGRAVFVGVLDAVRSRVLDLALDIERVAPKAGQPDATDEIKTQVAGVVNHYNFYGASNVAIGSSDVRQVSVDRGDEAGLILALTSLGIPAKQLLQLREALERDRMDAGGSHPSTAGKRVTAWIAQASTQVGTGATAGLITEAIKGFFGA